MIEVQEHDPVEQPVAADVSAGTLLRRAREEAGLHVAALAVSMKVPVRKLEALEQDRYDLLPDAVFARGLASSICRALKVDPQPVLDRLPQSARPRLIPDTDGLNAPFRSPGEGAAPGWTERLRQPVSLAVFVLLLGALILFLLPTGRMDEKPAQPAAVEAPVATAVQAVTAPQPAEPALMAASEPVPAAALPDASSPAAVPPVAAASANSAEASPRAPAVVPAPQSSASAAAPSASSATAADAAAGVLVIRARGESWVEVTDAAGVVVMRKVLTAGESANVSGGLPLQVKVGRVHLTDVLVRGKPFDMRRVSSNDVARFEVK